MKVTVVVIILIVYSLTTKGQDSKILKRKPWEEWKHNRLLQNTFNHYFSIPPADKNAPLNVRPGVLKFPLKGTYLGENAKEDKIYAMQPSKMPCLVPGKNTVLNMPVAGFVEKGLNHSLDKTNKNKMADGCLKA